MEAFDEDPIPKEADEVEQVVVVKTELETFDNRIMSPRVKWFNQKPERAQDLLKSLTPTKSSAPPLRIVDHMVSKYSREHSIMIPGENDVPIDMWTSYRRMLSNVGKDYFDVFKRKHAVLLDVCGTEIKTTIGQVVFFQWYHKLSLNGVLMENFEAIKEHMKETEAELKARRKSSIKKNRTRSRPDVVKPMSVIHSGHFTLSFT